MPSHKHPCKHSYYTVHKNEIKIYSLLADSIPHLQMEAAMALLWFI